MPQYFTPGVYIEEIERGPRPIEGVPTNIAAFLGETERGPTSPWLCTSWNDYARVFGTSFNPTKYMPYSVSGFFDNGGTTCYICRIVAAGTPAQAAVAAVPAAGAVPAVAAKPAVAAVLGASLATLAFGDYLVSALGPGLWGNRVFVKFSPSTTQIYLAGAETPIGVHLQIAYWESASAQPYDIWDPNAAAPANAQPPDQQEDFDDLVLNDPGSANYFTKRLGVAPDSNSSLITVALGANPSNPPKTPVGAGSVLKGGVDSQATPALNDYLGNSIDPNQRTGLAALLLNEFRDVSLVYAPNSDGITGVSGAIIQHCSSQKYRFAVIDAQQSLANSNAIKPRQLNDTSYAAYYYPWIWIADPFTGQRIKVPPGGSMLGIYARSDDTRGVFKAPANEIVEDALDLEYDIDDATQAILNPAGVNVIRKFPTRGIRIWGARTLSSDTLWKYVNVRRLFIFLERSIYEGTQWVVFEPNDERLWARVIDTIRLFLRSQWRQGALMGTTEADAFQIACDRSTMTQDDILNGRLICQVGIAPVRPAEFVIFQIYQNTAEAQA